MNRFFNPAEQVVSNDWYQRPLKMQAAALEKANAEQQKAIAGLNALTDLQIKHLPKDEQNVINYLSKIDKEVEELSQGAVGTTDLREKSGRINELSRRVAKDFRQEGYAGSIEGNYQLYSEWAKKVDESDVVSMKKEAAKAFVYNNYEGVGDYEGYGSNYNSISTFNLAEDADLGRILQEKLPEIKGDKMEGFTVTSDGKLKRQTWYNGGDGHFYKDESMQEEVTYEEAFMTSLNTLINDNKAEDDYNQRAMLGLERYGHLNSIDDIYLKDENGDFKTDEKGKRIINYAHPYARASHNQAIELSYQNISYDQKMKDDFVWQYKFKKQQDLLYEQNSMAAMGRGRVHLGEADGYLSRAKESLTENSNRLSQINAALETLEEQNKNGKLDVGDQARMNELNKERGIIKSKMNTERENIYGFLKAGAKAAGTEDELQMHLDMLAEEKFNSQFLDGTGKTWKLIEDRANKLMSADFSLNKQEAIKRAFVIETKGKRLPNNFNSNEYRDNYFNSAEFIEEISEQAALVGGVLTQDYDEAVLSLNYKEKANRQSYFRETTQKGIDSQDGLYADVEVITLYGAAGQLFENEIKAQLSKSYRTIDGKTSDHDDMKEFHNGSYVTSGLASHPVTGEKMISVTKSVGTGSDKKEVTKFLDPASMTLDKTLKDIPQMLQNSATVQRASGLFGVADNSEAVANVIVGTQLRATDFTGRPYDPVKLNANKNSATMFDPTMTFSGHLNSRNHLSFHSSGRNQVIPLPGGFAIDRKPVPGKPNASQWKIMEMAWNPNSSSYELDIARDAENKPLMQSLFEQDELITTNSVMLQNVGNIFGPQKNIAPKQYFNIPK